MSCCGGNKPEPEVPKELAGKSIPQLAGELKIVYEDNSLRTVSLDARDLWCIKALLTSAEKLGEEFSNANGRTLIMALKLRVFGADVEKTECDQGTCECSQA